MNQLIGGTLLFGSPAYVCYRALPFFLGSGHNVLAFAALMGCLTLLCCVALNIFASIRDMGVR